MQTDKTASMPSATNDSVGDSLRAAMQGESPSQVSEDGARVFDQLRKNTEPTDFESLARQNQNPENEQPEVEQSAEPAEGQTSLQELVIKSGGKEHKFKLDPNDERLKELLSKGIGYDRKQRQLAEERKRLQAEKDQYQKATVAQQRIDQAQRLLERGYGTDAMKKLLGEENWGALYKQVIDEELEYRTADPERRMEIEAARKERASNLQRESAEERIQELESKLNQQFESQREELYGGYLNDSKQRYDLSQWIDDTELASDLNGYRDNAALTEVVREQARREKSGERDITGPEIRKIFAKHTKKLYNRFGKSVEKTADQKIEAQSQAATQAAQLASQKNYGSSSALDQWKKSGGGMEKLLDMLGGNSVKTRL